MQNGASPAGLLVIDQVNCAFRSVVVAGGAEPISERLVRGGRGRVGDAGRPIRVLVIRVRPEAANGFDPEGVSRARSKSLEGVVLGEDDVLVVTAATGVLIEQGVPGADQVDVVVGAPLLGEGQLDGALAAGRHDLERRGIDPVEAVDDLVVVGVVDLETRDPLEGAVVGGGGSVDAGHDADVLEADDLALGQVDGEELPVGIDDDLGVGFDVVAAVQRARRKLLVLRVLPVVGLVHAVDVDGVVRQGRGGAAEEDLGVVEVCRVVRGHREEGGVRRVVECVRDLDGHAGEVRGVCGLGGRGGDREGGSDGQGRQEARETTQGEGPFGWSAASGASSGACERTSRPIDGRNRPLGRFSAHGTGN